MSRTPEHEVYIHSHAPVVVASHGSRTAAEAAAFVLPRLSTDATVIDLGCGPGSITVGLAQAVPAGHVAGIDAAPEVLEEAASRAAGIGNVAFAAASVYDLPFQAASFDAAYAHQLLQHLADPVAALEEAKRLLRSGGVIGVRDADYATMTHFPQDSRLDRWLEIYHQVARHNGGEPDAGRRLASWLRRAGFEKVVATSSTWTYADPKRRREWAELWARRIQLEGTFSASAVGAGISDRRELAAIGAAFQEWAEQPDGWFAFIHGEAVGFAP